MSYQLHYYAATPFPSMQSAAAGPYGSFPLAPLGAARGGCPCVVASHNAAAMKAAKTLHPYRRPGRKPAMGFYRPNQAIQRSVYGQQWLHGLGQGIDLSDPTTLLYIGGGLLAVVLLMGAFKGGRAIGRARKRHRRTRAARLRAQAAALEL